MKCPVCNTVNLVMAERQGVEIDYCPECRGVWLDRGELDKIVERSFLNEAPLQQPQQSQYQGQPPYQGQPQYKGQQQHHGYKHDDHGHGYGHKPYRKKSFLEELFD
ncbi:TFIIB-type zinc ribbon-containing protein [Citrifermentans bremense]|uniref:TFIIB-type zinc ribbon-containing protein n=1 Tax=Citrifermentans bremense TaxID=60035 RepID=UPI000408AB78|nr:zf-TFIIB domain-containing protein [Citrifermentans bremense]